MISKKHALIWIAIVSVTLAAAAFLVTFFAVKNARTASGEIYITDEQYQLLLDYNELDSVKQIIDDYYYQPVDEGAVLEGAKAGMVGALNDPYSVYYTADEYAALYDKLEGVYTGVGLVLSLDRTDGLATVVYVYPGSPADELGLDVGYKILAVDGQSVAGLDLEQVAEHMRGPDGTTMSLTYTYSGAQNTVEMERRTVEMDKASYTMVTDSIGYISIYEFTGNCVELFESAKQLMIDQGAQALILDLRNNPGGRLNFATQIADLLLPECDIVHTVDRDGNRITQSSEADCWDIPTVVLVNGSSASASEVLAGALQDNGRATIIGTQTYGKGVIQDIISIPETGSGVKITTGVYLTPNGSEVNEIGITPDQVVEAGASAEVDDQLNAAIAFLETTYGPFEAVATDTDTE